MKRATVGWSLVVVQVVLLVVLLLLPWRAPTVLSLIIGIVVAASGVIVLATSMRRLGRALTATPVPIQQAGLRTSGPYRFVRHPIYSGVLLLVLGLLIALGSAWSWAWGLVIVGFFWGKSRWEDSLLHEEYGEEWVAWAARTGALIPKPMRR